VYCINNINAEVRDKVVQKRHLENGELDITPASVELKSSGLNADKTQSDIIIFVVLKF